MASMPSALIDTRVIYCGDNLDQLKKLPNGCVDFIYIDPPFNSNRNYEVFWGETKEKRSFADRHESTKAYIEYMRPRCGELHRVLKMTGSFYYHCDWHASHYVKVMLDQIFGENQFQNEIIWKRQSGHSDARQGSRHFGRLHDTIFLYNSGDEPTWNQLYEPYDEEYLRTFYSNIEPTTGRRFQYGDLTAPGGAAPSKGNPYSDSAFEIAGGEIRISACARSFSMKPTSAINRSRSFSLVWIRLCAQKLSARSNCYELRTLCRRSFGRN